LIADFSLLGISWKKSMQKDKSLAGSEVIQKNTLQKDQAESNAKEVQLCLDYNP